MNKFSFLLKSLLWSLALSFTAFAAGPVDINTADATMLADSLTGIGPSKARAIVAFREANGPFQSADQLVSVKGIGLATVEKNRDQITVSPAAKAEAE